MWRAFCAFAFFALGWVGCASAESLYETLPPQPQKSFGADTSLVFIAPYTTRVETTLSASINKTTTSGNSASSANSASKATSPLVLRASWIKAPPAKPDQSNPSEVVIKYQVNCDLKSVLGEKDVISVSGIVPSDFNKNPLYVTGVEVNWITASTKAPPDPGSVPVPAPATASSDSKPPPAPRYISGGSISGVECPTPPDAFTVTLAVTPAPVSRGYLHLRRNPFYDDSVDFGVDTNGMLSNSDTSSTQEITAILTELAQTAAPFMTGALNLALAKATDELNLALAKVSDEQLKTACSDQLKDLCGKSIKNQKDNLIKNFPSVNLADLLKNLPKELHDALQAAQEAAEKAKLALEARAVCYKAIANFINTAPYYDTMGFEQIDKITTPPSDPRSNPAPAPIWSCDVKRYPKCRRSATLQKKSSIKLTATIVPEDDSVVDAVLINFTLVDRIDSYNQVITDETQTGRWNGVVAFFPVPATATIDCEVRRLVAGFPKRVPATVLLSPPTVVNVYTESHFLDPKRDFFTNPHDTFTFTAGLITGHKFTGQSAAKTIVDTITMPIRSMMPSVTVTQSVAVSPTGKTTTTSTQTGPPKGP